MKLLKYLYCRFYQLMVIVGNGDIAEFASILLMTFVFGINFLALFEFFDIIGFGVTGISKWVAVGIMVVLFFTLFILLVYNGKSSKMLESYENETKKRKAKGNVIIIMYIFISITALIATFLIKANINGNS